MIGTSTLNHSKSIIRYHDPYTRLNLRAKLDHVIQNSPKFHHINVIDIFPILDAIIKRGYIFIHLGDVRESNPGWNRFCSACLISIQI